MPNQFAIISTSTGNNAKVNKESKMDRKTQMHIEYLQEMLNTKWADEARKELAEIRAEMETKGIFSI